MNFLKPLLVLSFVFQCFHFHVLFFPSFNFLYHLRSFEYLTKSIFIPPHYSSLHFKDNLGLPITTDCRSRSSLLHPVTAFVVVTVNYVFGSSPSRERKLSAALAKNWVLHSLILIARCFWTLKEEETRPRSFMEVTHSSKVWMFTNL